MVKARELFLWTDEEILNYICDKFPLDPTKPSRIQDILFRLGIGGNLAPFLSHDVYKKGQFTAYIDPYNGDRIILYSPYYGKDIIISNIYSETPEVSSIALPF